MLSDQRVDEPLARIDEQAIIREARRRQHRRWVLMGCAVGLTAVAVAAIASGWHHGRGAVRPGGYPNAVRENRGTAAPLAAGFEPDSPQALATGPGGVLYVADVQRDQILERLPSGRFRVVAGDGKGGFSGDGGPAVKAQIGQVDGMAVGPDGTLYFADYGNARIRAVSLSGTITTVAGNGQRGQVPDGTPALAANLNPSAVTFSPDGTMYVASDPQVLRLGADRTFTCIAGCHNYGNDGLYGIGEKAVNGSADGPDGLAVTSNGDVYIAGFNTKTILVVTPDGTLHRVGDAYPRDPGGLVRAPDGSVIAMDELAVDRLSAHGIQPIVQFWTTQDPEMTYLGVHALSPDGIAIGADGTIYIDTSNGNGYSDKSVIAAISPAGHPTLLWQLAHT